jgi:hypothetical protein
MDDRLWDDAGREWRLTEHGLTSAEVEHLIAEPGARMCVHDDWHAPLR